MATSGRYAQVSYAFFTALHTAIGPCGTHLLGRYQPAALCVTMSERGGSVYTRNLRRVTDHSTTRRCFRQAHGTYSNLAPVELPAWDQNRILRFAPLILPKNDFYQFASVRTDTEEK
ncbi:hypothetical protein GGR58DRAFT_506243 [Xylaria digitata]|nr:hypothetical protein GGR58DRAFT_506243 [Xylaria digitata]